MGMTALCDLPDDEAISPGEFIERTEHTVQIAARALQQESENVEMAVFDMIKVRMVKLDQNNFIEFDINGYVCYTWTDMFVTQLFEETLSPDEMAMLEAQGRSENYPTWYHGIMGIACQKNTDALVKLHCALWS